VLPEFKGSFKREKGLSSQEEKKEKEKQDLLRDFYTDRE
jgi:hypothetical protein